MQLFQLASEDKPVTIKTAQVPTLTVFVRQHFLPWVDGCNRAPNTKQSYRYGWSLLEDQPIAKMRMDQIKSLHLDMIQVAGSPSTHNCALRTLRRIFGIAIELEVIAVRPKFRLLTENERTALVDPEIEAKIAAVLEGSKRKGALVTALYIILDCGMRPNEISRLRIEDIDYARGLIHVPKSKTKAGVRYLPMTTRLRTKLLEQTGKRSTGWVFPSPRYRGEPIKRHSLTVAWRLACIRAGVSSGINLYCARHTFGTDAMEATKNPFKVMKMLGHTSLGTTVRYQHHEIAEIGRLMDVRNAERHNSRHTGVAHKEVTL
jgi:integrase